MVTTNFTRHENETKVFDELLLWIQIIKPLKEFWHKVTLHPEGLLKISSFPWFPIERLHDWKKYILLMKSWGVQATQYTANTTIIELLKAITISISQETNPLSKI